MFLKSKRIKELEDNISKLEQELEEARELALDQHMELQFRDWEEEKNNPIYIEMTTEQLEIIREQNE